MKKRKIDRAKWFLLASLLPFLILSGCKKEAPPSAETTPGTTPSIPEITYPAATETLPPPAETLPANTEPVTWDETPVEGGIQVMIVIGEPLNVRLGPGTDYNVIATLGKDMKISVVAKTDADWFKLAEGGYYVSGEFLKLPDA